MSQEITNKDRAQWAAQAAYCFGSNPQCRGHLNATPADINDDDIGDLLVDIMHLCHAIGFDFNERLDTARGCYQEDISEEHANSEPDEERQIHLVNFEEIIVAHGADKDGEGWQRFTESLDQETCVICGAVLTEGWRSRENGEAVCNRHVTIPVSDSVAIDTAPFIQG